MDHRFAKCQEKLPFCIEDRGLIIRWSQVRILAGPPFCLDTFMRYDGSNNKDTSCFVARNGH